MNPFDVFNIPPSFDVDLKRLNQTYEDLIIQTHPDRFLNESDKANAMKTTIHINEAYALLKNPVQRLATLLKINGLNIPGEDGTTINDPDILTETMELQEQLLMSTPPHTILKTDIDARFNTLHKSIQGALLSPDNHLQKLYLRYVYLYKFMQRL